MATKIRKIGEINPARAHKLSIYHDYFATNNPYRVYEEWLEPGPYGLRSRKKLVSKYADLLSCVTLMKDYIQEHNEERR